MKKSAAIIVMLCMVLSLLAGCQNSSQADGTTAAPQGGAGTQADAGEKEAPRSVTLDVMMSFPRFQDQMEAYFEKFHEKMLAEKNIDVTINLEMPSSDSYENILQTRITGGSAPDLYTISATQDMATYQEAGYLEPLTSLPMADKLYENVRETVSIDGEVYAVPFESTVWGYLYNKDIFEECGLQVPETYDEMVEVIKTLEEHNYTAFELAFQEQWVPQLMTGLSIGGLVSGTPQLNDWVERMYADNGSYEEIREIFNIITLIMEHGTDRAMETGSEQGSADFANGKAAMWVQGCWNAESILSVNESMNLGCAALPVTNDAGCTLINLATTTALVVSADSDEKEIAMELADFILDDENSSALYESMMFNPVATCHNYEQYPWAQEASAYVAAGRAYEDLVLPGAVTDEQGKLLQSLYVGDVTVDDMIQTLDAAWKAANAANR